MRIALLIIKYSINSKAVRRVEVSNKQNVYVRMTYIIYISMMLD
jgi:hypothetical protein